MTPGLTDYRASAVRCAASVALLLGLLAAPGCRESPTEPNIPETTWWSTTAATRERPL